jgi:hypothetical protein
VLVSRIINFDTCFAYFEHVRHNNVEIVARREAARSRVRSPASTATKHGGDSRHCCFDINESRH